VIILKEESFVERILYRLARKHISGPTMSSALEKTKDLNSKNMPVSITFLSNSTTSKPKAKYVTSTYIELVRQLSRMGLKASIHVPLEQIGISVDKEAAAENLKSVLEVANKYGVFVWAEADSHEKALVDGFESFRGLGLAVPAESAMDYVKKYKDIRSLKIMYSDSGYKGKKKEEIIKNAQLLSKKFGNAVLFSTPDDALWKLLNNSKLAKSFIFEFRYGYSSKKIKKVMKKGGRVSVYMPFGKEWEAYAMNNVPEGYMRFLATKLLSEAEKSSGT
jgi:proline dehydrogenase